MNIRSKYITKQYTSTAYIHYGTVIAFGLFLISTFSSNLNKIAFVTSIMATILTMSTLAVIVPIRWFAIRRAIKNHSIAVMQVATKNHWSYSPTVLETPKEFANATLLGIGDRDKELIDYVQTPEWNYINLSYGIYKQTKYGDYKASVIYYTVMSAQLPRVLPNVFFDSKKARGRQFKTVFKGSQKHSLEGDFDEYFTTYFGEDYKIDSLSFITPEVMVALQEASDYDVEIINNQVMLYGPMFAAELQIPDMSNKLMAVKNKLMNNIVTYRDERLPFVTGRQTVTAEGLVLKRKKNIAWISIIVFIIYIAWQLYLQK